MFTLKWIVAFVLCSLCLGVFYFTFCNLRGNWKSSYETLFSLFVLIEISMCILLSFNCIKLPPQIPVDLYLHLLLDSIVNIAYLIAIVLYHFFLPVFMKPTLKGLDRYPTVMD